MLTDIVAYNVPFIPASDRRRFSQGLPATNYRSHERIRFELRNHAYHTMTTSDKLLNLEIKQQLRRLLERCDLDEFVKIVCEARICDIPTEIIIKEAVAQLAPVIYRDAYPAQVPHSLMMLMSAFQAGKYLKRNQASAVAIQALWYAGQEDRSRPYPLPSLSQGKEKVDLAKLEDAFKSRDFEKIMNLVCVSLADKKDFLIVRDRLMSLALKDIANLGHKLIYLMKTVEYLEVARGVDYERVLFPAVHYLVCGPRDEEYFHLLDTKLKRLDIDPTEFLANQGILSDDESRRLERVIIYQFPALVIENFVYALKQGIAIDELFQVILAAASQSILGAYRESWIFPIHAYNFTHEAWECFKRTSHALDKIHLLFMAALLTNKMATESINPHKLLKWEAVYLSATEISVHGLASAIENSEPDSAAALVKSLIIEKPLAEIAEALFLSAAKNDGGICFGHDIKFCCHAIADYTRSRIPAREKFLIALSYFLAEIEKDYDLYNALKV